jgi:hypothetical protein
MRWQEAALGTAVEKDAFRVLLEIERRLREEEERFLVHSVEEHIRSC